MGRVLIGCEESGKVRDAFAELGHDAWSNDLIPSRHGGKHLQMDVVDAIFDHGPWDLIILHPPCTALAVSGNSTYGKGMPKHHERIGSVIWTRELFRMAKSQCKHVALENPVGVLGEIDGVKPVYIHPWQFGHMEQKKTGLWLHGLPPLHPTVNVYEAMMSLPKNVRQRLHYLPPSPTRAMQRSETYLGIAYAMSNQWGKL